MLLRMLQKAHRSCAGCGGCQNVCPMDAIQMQPDGEGFLRPVIDAKKCIYCLACEQNCPQMHPKKGNDEHPECYAVCAGQDVADASASGGVFTILANAVFQRGGHVCGAAFDEDFRGVSLVMISDPGELHRLRGSKYVQAKPGHIYRDVERKLDDGEYVLFSGTPCQVAALRKVLKRHYDTLITVDILCSGVPSEEVYRAYIDEFAQGKSIQSVSFCPKKYGWEFSGIETVFADGTAHMIHSMRDPYMQGFFHRLYVGKACGDCPFAPVARQGDFTIGDFWQISRYDDAIDESHGVSCVLLNSQKAREIFPEILHDFRFAQSVPLSFLQAFNRMHPRADAHLARPRFFDLMAQGRSFKQSVDDCLNWKFDVAVTGCWTVRNYGGELSYYALYHVVKDLGYTAIMVERRIDLPGYDVPDASMFSRSPYPFYEISRIHKNDADQRELNLRVKNFVVGSDQVWNARFMQENSYQSYMLDYVEDYRKKIAYASSFGCTYFSGNDQEKKLFQRGLQGFDYLSAREAVGVELLQSEFGLDAAQVLDPIFLCDKRHLDSLVAQATCSTNGKYVFTYFDHPDEHKIGLDALAKHLSYGLVNTITPDETILANNGFHQRPWPYPYEQNCGLENWLKYLAYSSLVLTDSFYAACLAIRYHIPFVVVKGNMVDGHGLDVMESLLARFGLMPRMVESVKDILGNERSFEVLDYAPVDNILKSDEEFSLHWLKGALEAKMPSGKSS